MKFDSFLFFSVSECEVLQPFFLFFFFFFFFFQCPSVKCDTVRIHMSQVSYVSGYFVIVLEFVCGQSFPRLLFLVSCSCSETIVIIS